ncbi:hypothetical protein R5W24_006274 [Gemmata sp. JC717]|uniref:hypothetical protein n=1 Tax=Gemmata algarum TaxID=2975278 RepID=UPI0021BA4EEB|nr:hypothetical protein [Gemmata algarum]MDY3557087.1 hypothetical protein [Gemmata algarum]
MSSPDVNLKLPDPAPCSFVAVSEARRCTVPLSFVPADDSVRDWLSGVWKDLCNAVRRACELTKQPVPKWGNWQPWQWCYEKALLQAGRTPVLVLAENCPVGFMTLWPGAGGSAALYLEHIGNAPGDIATQLWNRRYHKVGWSLMAYAIHVSRENGFGGRVGLHAADDTILNKVYREYSRAVPGLFKADAKGIPGPTPYGPQKNLNLTYLETVEAQAEQFLEGFRNA